MKTYCRILLVAMATCLAGYACAFGFAPSMKVNLKVVDETGAPAAGADVRIGFFDMSIGGHRPVGVDGVTDSNGLFSAQGRTSLYAACQIAWEPDHHDYYYTRDIQIPVNESGRLTTVMVKRVRHPIPLYVSGDPTVQWNIPCTNTVLGFDCQAGDWVRPYGNGRVADFDVFYSHDLTSYMQRSFRLVLRGTTPGSGFLPLVGTPQSDLFSVCHAPATTNYANEIIYQIAFTNGGSHVKSPMKENGYLVFRSRCVTNTAGTIVSANYGKIYKQGSFYCDTGWIDRKSTMTFTVYFNPTPNDTNLEYDPNHDLNAKVDADVYRP